MNMKVAMKNTLYIISFLLAVWTANAVLVDDFEGYAPGDVDGVTGGAWVESPTRSSTGMFIAQEDTGNQVLAVTNGGDGQTGVYGVLEGDEIIALGETKTLFTRFYITGVSGDYDVSFGVTGVNAPTSWADLASYFTVFKGNFNVRQGTSNTTVASVQPGKWYYVWLVVNNISGVFNHSCYLKDVPEDATVADRVADNWGMRNTTGGNLDRLFGMTNAGDFRPVYFDNINITAGVSLELPSNVPVPPAIVSHPEDVALAGTHAASFTTVFTSQSTPSAVWYNVASPEDIALDPLLPDIDVQLSYDDQTLRYTSTLSMTELTASNAGQYYCRIANGSGLWQTTNLAALVVYGPVAHWTLNQDRFAAGQYLEELEGFHAAAAGSPVFVEGADGTANGAVLVSADDGWATVPVFDPVRQSGRMSIVFWADWYAAPGASQDLLAQTYDDQNQLSAPDRLRADGRWQQICMVFDGTVAKLYVDGVLQTLADWSLPTDTQAQLRIGTSFDGRTAFSGAVDDVKIFNYALTDLEVADLRYEFSGQASCILEFDTRYDLTGPDGLPDCVIDILDLVVLAGYFLETGSAYDVTGPAGLPDGVVDLREFAGLAADWMTCGLYPVCE